MPEHQSIEWKETWRDEYLEWICGYANANGGILYIGKNDEGKVVGIQNSKKLLEVIPSKITDTMGIVADVNLLFEDSLEYIEIVVEKYPSLISFHGKYYYRSGSTMRTITGKELDRKILKSQGKTWDGVALPRITVENLKSEAIQIFKDKAVARGRLLEEEVSVPDDILMENLYLKDEDDCLIRAAMLAFYENPEKWVTGSYIKIGYFGGSDADLQYQDEIHGPLIEQVDRAVDLVYTKYMRALIMYDGMQRVEQYMVHKDAFREILLNAIVHKLWKAFHNLCYAKLIVMQSQFRIPYKIKESGTFTLHKILPSYRFFFNHSIRSSFCFWLYFWTVSIEALCFFSCSSLIFGLVFA